MNQPLLTLGMPVYNGQAYLHDAITSLRRQSWGNFTLIISDNASTDDTPAIAAQHAAEDDRIRFIRQPLNLGAAGNFDFVLSQAHTPLFKWAAADDVHAGEFLAATVPPMLGNPNLLLAHTAAKVIDGQGSAILDEDFYDPPRDLHTGSAAERFAEILLHTKWCFEIFGVMRTETVKSLGGMRHFYGGDKVLLSQLAMRGPFHQDPRPLFIRRDHNTNSTSNKTGADRTAWLTAGKKKKFSIPQTRCFAGYAGAALASPVPLGQRVAASGVLLKYLVRPGRWGRLLKNDVVPQLSRLFPKGIA